MSEFSSKYWIPSDDIDFLGLKGVMEDEPKSVSRTRMKITFRQLKQMLPEKNLDNPVKILQATKRYMNHLQNCPPVNYNKCECFQKYLEESEEKSKELSEQWTKRFFFFLRDFIFKKTLFEKLQKIIFLCKLDYKKNMPCLCVLF